MGWVVLLASAGNRVGDVEFVSTIDDIAAAHDNTSNHVIDAPNRIDANDSNGTSCRLENSSLGTLSLGPEISGDGFVFLFLLSLCSGCCCVCFYFLFSGRRVV